MAAPTAAGLAAVVVMVMVMTTRGLAAAVPLPMVSVVMPPVAVVLVVPVVMALTPRPMVPGAMVRAGLAGVIAVLVFEVGIDLVEDLSDCQRDGLDPPGEVICEILGEELQALRKLDAGLQLRYWRHGADEVCGGLQRKGL